MFRLVKTIGINTNKYNRFCHHHSKRVFEAPSINCKLNEQNIQNTQQIKKLEEQMVEVKNNIYYIYLVNLYIVPMLVFFK